MPAVENDHRAKMLERVRALIAKANGTEFEAEREAFLAKADELMERYAIEQWQLETGNTSRKVERRGMAINWWYEMHDVHYEARNEIAWLWEACVRHTRCHSDFRTWSWNDRTAAVYGMPADLDYLDMLFTDLLLQLVSRIRPRFDPALPLVENVIRAKQAGMKWYQIAQWAGQDDPHNKRTHERLSRAYHAHLRAERREKEAIGVHPDSWLISYTQGFTATIRQRLKHQRIASEERMEAESTALVVRDIKEQAVEALFEDFPDLKPHAADCQCARCAKARKPVKYRDSQPRAHISAAYGQGVIAGEQARIGARDRVGTRSKGELA